MLLRERKVSWFRQATQPAATVGAEVRAAEERPWLQEQLAYWSSSAWQRQGASDYFTMESPEQRIRYRLMLAEPTVKAAFLGKLVSVSSQELRCVPPEGEEDNPWAKEIADFAQANLIGPSGTSHEIIWEIGSGMLLEGFSVSEKLMRPEEYGKYKGKWVLDKLKSKDPQTIQFELDQFRNVVGLYNTRGGQGQIAYDPNDFAIAVYLSFYGAPHGMSDFRATTRAVEMMVSALKLRTLTLDKFVGPYLKGKPGALNNRNSMATALKQARASGLIVLDPGDEVEVLDLASRGTTDFQSAIDDIRKEIAIGLQGAFLQMLTDGGGSDMRGDSRTQKDTSELFAYLVSVIIMGVINTQIMPDLIRPNFGDDAPMPTCVLGAVNPDDIVAELKIDQMLNSMGVDLSLSDLIRRANRKPPRDKADVLPGQKPQSGDAVQPGQQQPAPFSEQVEAQAFDEARAADGRFGTKSGDHKHKDDDSKKKDEPAEHTGKEKIDESKIDIDNSKVMSLTSPFVAKTKDGGASIQTANLRTAKTADGDKVYRWEIADHNGDAVQLGQWTKDRDQAESQGESRGDEGARNQLEEHQHASAEEYVKNAGEELRSKGIIDSARPRSDETTPQNVLPPQSSIEELPAPVQEALKHYTRKGDELMNGYLRRGDEVSPEVKAQVDELNKTFAALPPFEHPVVTWRGLKLGESDKSKLLSNFEAAAASGEPVEMKGFTSTSINPKTASGFGDVVFEITAKKGLYLEPVTQFEGEKEMLLPHGAKYKVHAVTTTAHWNEGLKPVKTIQLEQII